jgi:hypothetical protein
MRRCQWALLSVACSCSSVPPAPLPAPVAPPLPAAFASAGGAAPPAPRYADVFDELVRRIERDHVFPPRYAHAVGHAFREDVPRLRDEFARAEGRTGALIALRHLQNSLRDPHCQLDPPGDLERRRLTLGVRFWTGGTAAAPEVRVVDFTDLDTKVALTPGDAVVSVDGAPVAAWVSAHPFETARLSPEQWLAETVARIGSVELPWSTVREGDARVLGIVHEGAPREVTLRFHRESPRATEPDLDHPPPMAAIDCDAAAPIDYGDYALAATGVNVCVYRPRKATRPRVPVVRYLSFGYGGAPAQTLRMVRVDHDMLAHALRDADGVVLDVHEDHGGNNPFIFAGWFSGGPWDHPRVVTRVVPGLDAATLTDALNGELYVPSYFEAQKLGHPTFVTRFLCAPGHCDGDAPDVAERVTRAPVALVTGPGCASSCDTLALTWASFHLGPVLGKQPMHAYTVNRLPIHVTGPAAEDLGRFRVALSQSELREGVSVEGEPLSLDWEAPATFEANSIWVRQAVEEARRRLAKR